MSAVGSHWLYSLRTREAEEICFAMVGHSFENENRSYTSFLDARNVQSGRLWAFSLKVGLLFSALRNLSGIESLLVQRWPTISDNFRSFGKKNLEAIAFARSLALTVDVSALASR